MESEQKLRSIMQSIVLGAAPKRTTPDTVEFEKVMSLGKDYSDHLDRLYDAAPANDYLALHRVRFKELFAFIGGSVRSGRLLEIGTAFYTSHFYKKVFPELELHTVCRPESMGGRPRQWAINAGSSSHTQLDLNAANLSELAESLGRRRYDFIACCEVVEHLSRDPEELFGFFSELLSPTGALFVTTPNFMCINYMMKLGKGYNPAARFKPSSVNIKKSSTHFHVREYTISELISFAQGAGAHIRIAAYSNCWDRGNYQSPKEFPFRRNLVLVLANPDGIGKLKPVQERPVVVRDKS